jgi:hypothetical protein
MNSACIRLLLSEISLIVVILLSGTTNVAADLTRANSPGFGSSVQHARLVPSFPESPLLDLRERSAGLFDSFPTAGRWRGDVEHKLAVFLNARRRDSNSPCNEFVAKALKVLFNITDFDLPAGPERHLSANQMAHYMATHLEQWTLLGPASNQVTLERAQLYANLNTPVIAAYAAAPHGHVAIVLPGRLQYSGRWNLQVPNSASLFLNRLYKSYIGLSLSNAFQAAHLSKVNLYIRTAQD